jgi:hypothetical protein
MLSLIRTPNRVTSPEERSKRARRYALLTFFVAGAFFAWFAVVADAVIGAQRAELLLLEQARRVSASAPRVARAAELSVDGGDRTIVPAPAILAFSLGGGVLVGWGLLLVGLGWRDPRQPKRAAGLLVCVSLLLPALLFGISGGLPILLAVPFLVKAVNLWRFRQRPGAPELNGPR